MELLGIGAPRFRVAQINFHVQRLGQRFQMLHLRLTADYERKKLDDFIVFEGVIEMLGVSQRPERALVRTQAGVVFKASCFKVVTDVGPGQSVELSGNVRRKLFVPRRSNPACGVKVADVIVVKYVHDNILRATVSSFHSLRSSASRVHAVSAASEVADWLADMGRQYLLPGFAVVNLLALCVTVAVRVDSTRTIGVVDHLPVPLRFVAVCSPAAVGPVLHYDSGRNIADLGIERYP